MPGVGAQVDFSAFQSAPLTEARGDTRRPKPTRRLTCFNPLPSPKQGETRSVWRGRRRVPGFNPLPSPKQGETRWRWAMRAHHHSFQSAPLTEARGDSNRTAFAGCPTGFNPLPSPKQGETDPMSKPTDTCFGFNPLPSPKQGETRADGLHRSLIGGFNPLPSPKQGETEHGGLIDRNADVSIRSPHRSKGRHS